MALGKLVGVEEHLFGRVRKCALRVPGVRLAPAPAVDLVVETLHRPRIAPPTLVEDGRRIVSLLDPGDDLAVQAILQVGDAGHDRIGEVGCFLGLVTGTSTLPTRMERVS